MNPRSAPFRTALLVALCAASLAAFLLTFVQSYGGLPFRARYQIDPHDSFLQEGIGYRGRFPREVRNPVAEAQSRLLEDGRLLGPRTRANQPVKDHGGGRFNIQESRIWYSTSDNSDPRTNGRTYEISAPVPLAPGWAAAAFAAFLASLVALGGRPGVTGVAARWRARLSFVSTTALAAGLAVAAVVAGPLLLDSGTVTDGFAVKDMPYSDAQGWHELAIDLANGRGLGGVFGAQRPLHPTLLGALYLVVPPSVSAAQAFNVAVWALMVFFATAMAGQAASRALALGVGTVILASPFHQDMLHLILTEELATMLGLASLYVFWLALCLPRRHNGDDLDAVPEWKPAAALFIAGMLFGFSNLARPLTVLAAPLLGAVVLLDALALRRAWFRRTFVRGIALTAGVAIVIIPWVVRQHHMHGIWSISSTSADLLYAGAKDEPWSVGLHGERVAAGVDDTIKAKVDFFMGRYRETVAADPAGYLAVIGRNVAAFLDDFALDSPEARLAGLAFAFVAAVGVWLRFGSVGGVAAFAFTWPLIQFGAGSVPPAAAVGAALALGLWRGSAHERLLLLAALALLVGNALLSAMIGNFGLNRMSGLRDVILTLFLFNGIRHVTISVAQLLARTFGGRWLSPEEGSEVRPGLPLVLAVSLTVIATLSSAVVAARNLGAPAQGPDPGPAPTASSPAAPPELPENLRWAVVAWMRTRLPEALDAAGLPSDAIEIDLVSVGEYRVDLAAGEDVGHWARPFQPRPYARTVAYVRRGGSHADSRGLAAVVFPEFLPPTPSPRRCMLIGVRNHDPDAHLGHDRLILEALALIPLAADSESLPALDQDSALRFEPSPEARLLLGLPDSATEPR